MGRGDCCFKNPSGKKPLSCEVDTASMHALCFSWHIAEYAKKKKKKAPLEYLLCHCIIWFAILSVFLARFLGLGGSTAVGRGSADRRECKAAVDRGGSMVKTLCGSCWEGTALDGRDVNGGEGKGGLCLGWVDGEALETLVWCSAVRSVERAMRSGHSRYRMCACSSTWPSHLFPITTTVQREAWASRNQGRT